MAPVSSGPVRLPDSTRLANQARRADIQGLRAIAVLLVVAYHAGLPIPGGFVGVDMFFVISGFVITLMLVREWQAVGRIRFGRFYLRRFKRLTPALAVMVSVVVIASVPLLSPLGPQETAAKTAIGTMLLVANFVIQATTGGYFDQRADLNPLLNTWSLSVEEQFYLVFPAVLAIGWAAARRSRMGPRSAMLLVALVALSSFGLALLGSSGFNVPGSAYIIGFYSPFSRAWEFAAGALLALAAAPVRFPSRAVTSGVSGLGFTLLAFSLFLIDEDTPFPGVWTLLPVAATLLLIAAGTNGGHWLADALGSPMMGRVGDWSYSIYLWHWPLIVFASLLWPGQRRALVLAALVSLIPAVASYRWVEQPLRSISLPRGRHIAAMIAVTMFTPLALSVALLASVQQGFWMPIVRHYQTAIVPEHAGRAAGCGRSVPLTSDRAADCTWNASAGGSPIYLVGDSNADHFGEAVIGAGVDLGMPVLVGTSYACPFIQAGSAWTAATASQDSACRDYVSGTMSFLESAPPGVVVLSMSDKYWYEQEPSAPSSPDNVSGDEDVVDAVQEGLAETVQSIQDAGHSVVLVQSVPKWSSDHHWDPSTCTIRALRAGECTSQMALTYAEARQGPVRGAFVKVAQSTGATLVDTWPMLCSERTCTATTGALIRYRDESHISVPQSQELIPDFVSALESVPGNRR